MHGCYWHGHRCSKGRLPKSGLDYWGPKIEANRERDARKEAGLREMGYDVLTVWQCEVADGCALATRLKDFVAPENCDRHEASASLSSQKKTD